MRTYFLYGSETQPRIFVTALLLCGAVSRRQSAPKPWMSRASCLAYRAVTDLVCFIGA